MYSTTWLNSSLVSWEYIGNGEFKNVYNGKVFKASEGNLSHIFSGRTTIDKLIVYEINGKHHSAKTRKVMAYAISQKGRIE